jgi:hypothetical protein
VPKFRNAAGNWIMASPDILNAKPPLVLHLSGGVENILDDSMPKNIAEGGIYNSEELKVINKNFLDVTTCSSSSNIHLKNSCFL